jgi:3'(2'), 5'-bisphosphate nucleotidase
MTEELDTALGLARSAGAILLDYYARAPSVDWKGPNDPVTSADKAASRFLVTEFRRLYPGDGILSEEAVDDPARLGASRVWIVDPMDGTKEFISRCDEFSVMIGLAVNGKGTVGVVHQPTTGKAYYAVAGQGAFRVEGGHVDALTVSTETDPANITLALSRSHSSTEIATLQGRLGITSSITSGSLGLKAGLIAEGRAHLYLNTSARTYQWDTCAADVILSEAGGRMTDLLNHRFRYNRIDTCNRDGVIASNGAIHEYVAREVHGNRESDSTSESS